MSMAQLKIIAYKNLCIYTHNNNNNKVYFRSVLFLNNLQYN